MINRALPNKHAAGEGVAIYPADVFKEYPTYSIGERAYLEFYYDIKRAFEKTCARVEVDNHKIGASFIRFELTSKDEDLDLAKLNAKKKELKAMMYISSMCFADWCRSENGIVTFGLELERGAREIVGIKKHLSNCLTNNKPEPRFVVCLGEDVDRHPKMFDFGTNTALLLAGGRGAGGMDVLLRSIVATLVCLHPADELQMLVIDNAHTDFTPYNGTNYLITNRIITDTGESITALAWLVEEVFKRRRNLTDLGYADINDYYASAKQYGEPVKIPHILAIINDIANLQSVGKEHINILISKICSLGAEVGVHLVVGTDTADCDVIDEFIKNQLPYRAVFATNTYDESCYVVGERGAEELLGAGDMLFRGADGKVIRLQAPTVSKEEVEELCKLLSSKHGDIRTDAERRICGKSYSAMMENGLVQSAMCAIVSREKGSLCALQSELNVEADDWDKLVSELVERGFMAEENGRYKAIMNAAQYKAMFCDNI